MSSQQKKFQIGDKVRISKHKHIFEKGYTYTPSWTTEIFQICRMQPTEQTTYLLNDLHEQIAGSIY